MWNQSNCNCKQKNIHKHEERKNCCCCRSRLEKKCKSPEENYNNEEINDVAYESEKRTRSSANITNDGFDTHEDLIRINCYCSSERCMNALTKSVLMGNDDTSLTKVITSSILSRMISKIYRDVHKAVHSGDLNKHGLGSSEQYKSNVEPKTDSTHGYQMNMTNGSDEHEDRSFFNAFKPDSGVSKFSNSDNGFRDVKSKEHVVRISTYSGEENTNPNRVSITRSSKADKNNSDPPAKSSRKKSVTLDPALKELFVSSMLSRMISKIYRNSEMGDLNEHGISSPEKYEPIVEPKNESRHSYQIYLGQPDDIEEDKDRNILKDVELEVQPSKESKFLNSDNSIAVEQSKERLVRISTYSSDNKGEDPLAESTYPNQRSSVRSTKVDENYFNSPTRSSHSHKKSVALEDNNEVPLAESTHSNERSSVQSSKVDKNDSDSPAISSHKESVTLDPSLKDLFVSSMLSRMISKVYRNSEMGDLNEHDLSSPAKYESIVEPKNESRHSYQIYMDQPDEDKDRNILELKAQHSRESKLANSDNSIAVEQSKEQLLRISTYSSDNKDEVPLAESIYPSQRFSVRSAKVDENYSNSPTRSSHSHKKSVALEDNEVLLADSANPNERSSVQSSKVDKNYSDSPARSSHKTSVTLDPGLKDLLVSSMLSRMISKVYRNSEMGDLNEHDLNSPAKYESITEAKNESRHSYEIYMDQPEEDKDRNILLDVELEARQSRGSKFSNSDNSMAVEQSTERLVRISTYNSDNNSEAPLAETNPNELSSVRSDENYLNSPTRSIHSHKKSVSLEDDNNEVDLAERTDPNERSSVRSAKLDENYSNTPARSSHEKSVTSEDDTVLKELIVSSMLTRMISEIIRNSEEGRDLNQHDLSSPEKHESIVGPKIESTHGYQINTAQPNDSDKDPDFIKDVKPEVQQSSEHILSNSSNTVMSSKEHSQKNFADHIDRKDELSSTENAHRSSPSSVQSSKVSNNTVISKKEPSQKNSADHSGRNNELSSTENTHGRGPASVRSSKVSNNTVISGKEHSPKNSAGYSDRNNELSSIEEDYFDTHQRVPSSVRSSKVSNNTVISGKEHSPKNSADYSDRHSELSSTETTLRSRPSSLRSSKDGENYSNSPEKSGRGMKTSVTSGDLNEHDLSLPEANVHPKKESKHEDQISQSFEVEDSEDELSPNKLSSLKSSLVILKSREQVKSSDGKIAESTSSSEISSAQSVEDRTVSFGNSKKSSSNKNSNRLSASVDDYSEDNKAHVTENMFSVLSDGSLGEKSSTLPTSNVVTEPLEDNSATNGKVGSIFEKFVNDTDKVEPYIVPPKSDHENLLDFPRSSKIHDEQLTNEFKNKYYNMIENRLRTLSEEIEQLVSSDETGFLDMLRQASESVGVNPLNGYNSPLMDSLVSGNVDRVLTAINEIEEEMINTPKHRASPDTPTEKSYKPTYTVEEEEYTNTIDYEEENKGCHPKMQKCAGQRNVPTNNCCRCGTHHCPKPVIKSSCHNCPYHPFSWCGNTFKKCCHSNVTSERPRCGMCRQRMSDCTRFSEGTKSRNAKLQTDLET